MKTAGIIAEYNPFHNGHFYHVRQTRAAGYSHIVAVMSGNVVQRSEVACFSKWTRASAAVKSGVNLVIELPAVYAVASAEKFASAGVSLLDGLGLIDGLSFGSESGNLQELFRCAEACMKINGSAELTGFLSQGLSFPKAREKAVEQIAGSEVSKLLRTPNNILGVEYLKALQNIGSSMEPITIRRKGPGHDSKEFSTRYASASLIRETLQQKDIYDLHRFFPEEAFYLFRQDFALKAGGASMYELTTAILYKLRTMTPEDFARLPDVSEGLEYRLCAEAKNAISIDDYLKRVKTKRYTMSRLKRIIICALLGIDKELMETQPPYIRVLAFDSKGKEILREAKKSATLPIYHSFAKLQEDFPVLAEKEALATDLFRYACPKIPAGNSEYQDKRPFAIRTGGRR